MGIRQSVALLLSTDLHAVARRLQKADRTLQEAQGDLAAIVAAAPPELKEEGLYGALQAIGLEIGAARFEVISARADLTGRGPEALQDPNRG